MKQQNQKLNQQLNETSVNEQKRKMSKRIMVALLGFGIFLLIVGGILLLMLHEFQLQQNQIIEEQLYGCTVYTECVLVQDGWCGTVLAVNKEKETGWRKENVRQTEIAKRERWTCKPTLAEYVDVANFEPVCRQSRCLAQFIGTTTQDGIDTSTWQTYRNDELGFEVKYPKDWEVEGRSRIRLKDQSGTSIITIFSFDSLTTSLNYCETHREDVRRCEKFTQQTTSGIIDWEWNHQQVEPFYPIAYAIIGRDNQMEFGIQLEAPEINSDTKKLFRLFFSTFRFVDLKDEIEANIQKEDGTLSFQLVNKLARLGPKGIEALPYLEHDLSFYKDQIRQFQGRDMFLLRDDETPGILRRELFVNSTSLADTSTSPYMLLISQAIAVDTAIRSIKGTLQLEKYGQAAYALNDFAELGIQIPLKIGDTVWLWTSDRQWKATLESLIVKSYEQSSFSGITFVVNTEEALTVKRYGDSMIILSLQPFPKQTWSVADLSPADTIAAEKTIAKLNVQYTKEEKEELEAINAELILPQIVLVQTKQHGDFMVVTGIGYAAGEGVSAREMILRRVNNGSWEEFIGPEEAAYGYPFIDIDGDGVPEFFSGRGYYDYLISIFPEAKIILTYNSGV